MRTLTSTRRALELTDATLRKCINIHIIQYRLAMNAGQRSHNQQKSIIMLYRALSLHDDCVIRRQ
jgi:hypothetical protein